MFELILLLFSVSTPWVLSLGFLLGLKHATEADHLAAVSTIVAERKSLLSSAIVGGLWGLGHTISLIVIGVFVLLLNFNISEQTERLLEFCVGVMLVLLGLNVLRNIIQNGGLHSHSHKQGYITHTHSPRGFSFSPRAVVIGMIHGLAGSAALMLLVVPTIESQIMGLIYIVIFGIGSIGGMMLMSFLVSLPFQITALRFDRFNLLLQCIAGLVSVALGLMIIYEKGFS